MSFGDWEMFKVVIITLREYELTFVTQAEELATKNVRFLFSRDKRASEKKRDHSKEQDKDCRRITSKSTPVENQVGLVSDYFYFLVMNCQIYFYIYFKVTLEDQMICGALQTLNEEACEDVLEESNEAGELVKDKEDFVNAVTYDQHGKVEATESVIYLKKYKPDRYRSEWNLNEKRQAVQDRKFSKNSEESESESSSNHKHLLGFDPAALYVKYPKKDRLESSEPSTSKGPVSGKVSYKDNVAHVHTQTPISSQESIRRVSPPRQPPQPPPSQGDSEYSSNNKSGTDSSNAPPQPPENSESRGSKNSSPKKEKNSDESKEKDAEIIYICEDSKMVGIKSRYLFTI